MMSEKEKSKASLLERWKNKKKQEQGSANEIAKAPAGINIPLSYGQKRLWFLQQMYPNNPFYNYSETYTFTGTLKVNFLLEALKRVYQDHGILRTTYHVENEEIFQKVDNDAEMDIAIHDLSASKIENPEKEALKIMQADAFKHFDLEKSPLFRVSLIKINTSKHILQVTLHHIVTDKWSMRIFRQHLADYYLAFTEGTPLPKKEKLQYVDYAYWQDKKEINAEHFNYWKEKLSGEIPNLNLPTDYTRPLHPTFKGAACTKNYNKDFSTKILNLAKQLETTPFNLMLAVYYIFLHKYCGQEDILIGTPITSRHEKELEGLIGFFNDTVVLRTEVNADMSTKELINRVRQNHLEALHNKDIHFDYLVGKLKVNRSLSINPFFQVMFLYHSVPENPNFGKNLTLSHTWFDFKVSKFDLTIYIAEENGVLSTTFEYASDLFHKSTIERFLQYYKILIEEVVANPDKPIGKLKMLLPEEKVFLLNKTSPSNTPFSNYEGIHNIIENISKSTPNAIAVTYKEEQLTYKELNDKANSVAKKLISLKTNENDVIGLCIERSTDMIVGILAILKSGCAYLPLDPEYPKERIDFMLEDAEVKTILTTQAFSDKFAENKAAKVYIDSIDTNVSNYNGAFPKPKASNLAYIIYTSGSTGKPKGVPITHKNIISSTGGRLSFYDKNPSAFLLMSSISFDSSKAGIFWTLCTGGNLVIAEKRIEQDIEKIGDVINKNNISHTLMLPSLYKLILEFINVTKLQGLTHVIVAGEACSSNLCIAHFKKLPNVNLYNEYGPTEGSVWCIAHKISKENIGDDPIPIGEPVANSKIYILDEHLNPVPFGCIGEIYLGGPGLTTGYIKRPDLNQKAFVKNPFNPSEKLYKTGDLAKYNRNKEIEFLGRSDQQIKIRGYRVELSEIEKVIASYSNTIDNTFVLIEDNSAQLATDIDIINNQEKSINNLLKQMNTKEIDSIMSSVKALSSEQKKYLLNQLGA